LFSLSVLWAERENGNANRIPGRQAGRQAGRLKGRYNDTDVSSLQTTISTLIQNVI
jgi:hypothetical protein